ncbi:phage portal protein [Paraclostridium ghonii]|uniref:phage tail assembly chaperone n=1 Tax=Paraclostridium ghonii TaxID=29358 RepID=UPI00202D0886|nr:phage portal protein [Paeniclostridium ghonii]MCM0167001.1 phage portal protein [Paeniclostridium ghonii]
MSNAIELLLNANDESFERPSRIIEIPRLSKVLGAKFELKCKCLTMGKTNSLRMQCTNQKTGEVDIPKLQVKTLIEGVFDAENGTSFFKNKDLHKRFGVPNAEEFMNKLLLMGEVDYLFEVIGDLGGFNDGTVEAIKN